MAEPGREVLDRRVAARAGDGDVRSRVPRGRVPDRGRRRDRDRRRARAPGGSGRRHRHPGRLERAVARVEPRSGSSGRSITSSPYGSLDPEERPRAEPLLVEAGAATVLLRGLRKRCPRCGERRIFRSWFHLIERCPNCALRFEREQGGFLGAMTINFLVVVVVWVAMLVVVLVLHGARRTGGTAADRERRGAGRGAAVVLPAVQDPVGGDRVPGGQERPGLPHAGQTRPSNEGPGVAERSGDRPGPLGRDRLVAGRVDRVDLERVVAARTDPRSGRATSTCVNSTPSSEHQSWPFSLCETSNVISPGPRGRPFGRTPEQDTMGAVRSIFQTYVMADDAL